MKAYQLIEGSSKDIESFETKISAALEEGYELASDMTTVLVSADEVRFYQSLTVSTDVDMDFDDEEDMEYDDEEIYEDSVS